MMATKSNNVKFVCQETITSCFRYFSHTYMVAPTVYLQGNYEYPENKENDRYANIGFGFIVILI
jgi:hypothetical protein